MIDSSLFQLAAEQTKDYAVFLLDVDGNVISWNLGAERIKGYAPDEIIGRHFSTFYTRESVASGWPDHELTVAAAEGRFEDEGWRVRKDGSRFWASVVITALRDRDGKLLGFSKITRDLTERRMHEEALAQSEERFRLLVEGVVDYAIYMLDPEGIITSWNAGAEKIKGYKAGEVIGRHFSRFFIPEDLEAGKPWHALAMARRTGRFESEGWRVRKDGTRFWARAVVNALHDAGGRLRGFAKITQDLTERRQVRDLEEAARNVNEFIAVLAHELRNPLAPLRTAVEVIGMTRPGDPAREAMYGTIDRQSAHLARIVDDMLDIARISRGEISIERRHVDLSGIARRATETASPAIQEGRHRLEMELTPEAVTVHGDAHRLTQLVANLLNNAARYTPPGGLIRVSTAVERGWGRLSVRDNGRGIRAEWTDRIFDMFVHGRSVTERRSGGLGIGLALSRRIAELHGGSLEAHSAGENQGAEFVLRVPLAPSAAAAANEPDDDGERIQASPSRRVLVVDDNVDAAITMEMLLKTLGHEVSIVHGGEEALQAVHDFRPDVVLLDIGLPGLNGYEVAQRLQALKKERGFRIVAVTGWGQETDKRKSREAGFDLHLVKPIEGRDLAAVLAEHDGATLQ